MLVKAKGKEVIKTQAQGSQGPVQTGVGASSQAKDSPTITTSTTALNQREINPSKALKALKECKHYFYTCMHYYPRTEARSHRISYSVDDKREIAKAHMQSIIKDHFGLSANELQGIISSQHFTEAQIKHFNEGLKQIVSRDCFACNPFEERSIYLSLYYEFILFDELLKILKFQNIKTNEEFKYMLRIYDLQRTQIHIKSLITKKAEVTLEPSERSSIPLELYNKYSNDACTKLQNDFQMDALLGKGLICFKIDDNSLDSLKNSLYLIEKYYRSRNDTRHSEIFNDTDVKGFDGELTVFLQEVIEVWKSDKRIPTKFATALESIMKGKEWQTAFNGDVDSVASSEETEESSKEEVKPEIKEVQANPVSSNALQSDLMMYMASASIVAFVLVLFAAYYNFGGMHDDTQL